ncbi:MAG: leucine-rich repeat protein [Flavobacteriaceae bacterium]|nr:leucine-rich repeat protein [Flavobacteriaceae bacterium]
MKKVFSILIAVIIGVVTIISCKKDDLEAPAKKVELEKSSVSMSIGEEVQVGIIQGNDGYKVTSSAPSMVTAKVILDIEKKKKYVVLKAKSAGNSKVTVTDSRGQKAEIKVAVIAKLSLPQKEVSLGKGAMKDYQLNGTAKDFGVASSDDNIVKAEIKDGKLVLTAVGSGKVKVTVADKRTGKKTVMDINVPEEIKDVAVEKTELPLAKGAKDVIEITEGSGKYEVKSSNKAVATAEIKGGTVVVKSVAKGTSDITVTDKVTKKETTIKVTVTNDIPAIDVEQKKITLQKGKKEVIEIKAGSGKYAVKSSTKEVATAEVKGGTVVINSIAKGTSDVTVTDETTNKTVVIKVTVTNDIPEINVEENELNIEKGQKEVVAITAGSGNYDAKSSNSYIAIAEVKGGTVVIKSVAKGTSDVTVTDKTTNKTVIIKVTVTEDYANIALKDGEITIKKGENEVVAITAGSGEYKVLANTPEGIASAKIVGTTLKVEALKKGLAVITVQDLKTTKTAFIKVTVSTDSFIVNKENVTLKLGENDVVYIKSGSGKYKVTGDDFVDAKLNGTEITLTAKKVGEGKVTVKDTEAGTSKDITVKVTGNLALSKNSVNVGKGATADVVITSGSGEYTVTSKNPDVAIVTKTEANITITGVKNGTTEITVKDNKTKETAVISVTVKAEALAITKEAVNDLGKGRTAEVFISSGSGNYEVVSKDKNVATVARNGNVITITGAGNGTTKITVKDTETNETKTITVSVKVQALALAKDKLTFGNVGMTEVVAINKGVAGTVSVEPQGVVTAKLVGTTIVVESVKKGNATITITDKNGGENQTITAKVTDDKYADIAVADADKNTIVKKGGKGKAVITAGSGKYKAKVNNTTIATAEVKGTVVEIIGVSKGSTFIEVTDLKTYKSVKINVTVSTDAFVISKESVTLKLGETETIIVKSGSGNYEIGTSEFVDVTEANDELTIMAKKVGAGKVTVKDTDANEIKEISVTVTGNLELSTESVTVQKGMNKTVVIKSGTGSYEITPATSDIATATESNGTITIEGKKKGEVTFTVKDTKTEETKEIAVTVSVDEFALLETETEITLRKGDVKELHIVKGSGNYEVNSNETAVATVVLEGTTVKITGVEGNKYTAKTTTITVTDTEANVSKEFTVKVFKKLSIGTKVIEIKQGDYGNSPIVEGDKEHITVTIDDDEIASYEMVEVNGLPEIKFTGLKPGTTFATVTDGSNDQKVVAITVKAIEPVKIVDFNGENVTNVEVTEDTPGELTLKDGSGQYDITYAPEGIVTADAQTFGDSGFLSITAIPGGTGGEVVVTLTDRVSGDTAQITVNVKVKTPITFTYTKEGASVEPNSFDTEGDPVFNTKVGETIVITVAGGSGTGYKVMGASDSHFEFNPGKTLTGNTVSVKMKAVGTEKYFKIVDSDGNKKYITFKITEAGGNASDPNFEVDANGVVSKKAGGSVSGDVVLPAGAKTVPYTDSPFYSNNNVTSIDFGSATTIEKMSVMNSKNLTTIHLRNVTSIGMGAFANCSSLSNVYCYMTTPPSLANMAFKNVTAVLHVPTGTKQAYIDAGFTMFSNIVEDAN